MIRKILIPFFLAVLVSCYFYPVGFTFLPDSVNTKIILSVVGLMFFAYDCVCVRGVRMPWNLVRAAFIAGLFSLACLLSITVNNTDDTVYSSYIMSFLVWTFGAYAVCFLLRLRYGKVDIRLIAVYLAVVGVAQCILSQMIHLIPSFQMFVDSIFEQNQVELHQINRLYGIGASLDSAGVRMSVTLILLGYLIVEAGKSQDRRMELKFAYISFILISILGNIIARTTTVGLILGVVYILISLLLNMSFKVKVSQLRSLMIIVVLMALLIPLLSWLYTHNPTVREDLRFAFEGFFNWQETGVWRTDSTDKLNAHMWVWPTDNMTWFLGTGLFEGWIYGTDIGYCRIILYCGLLGFSVFSLFFIYNSIAFYHKFPGSGILAFILLTATFVIWMKVATDIYLIYALFYWADIPERGQIQMAA